MTTAPTAIVTGGAQGIGKAMAMRFLQNGVNVAIADVDEEAGRETVRKYESLGKIRFIPCDVSDDAQARRLIDETVEEFRGIDELVNNAGVSRCKPLYEATLEDWNAVIGTNLTGAFLCSKYPAPYLPVSRGAGR